jgi:hypothetical protein
MEVSPSATATPAITRERNMCARCPHHLSDLAHQETRDSDVYEGARNELTGLQFGDCGPNVEIERLKKEYSKDWNTDGDDIVTTTEDALSKNELNEVTVIGSIILPTKLRMPRTPTIYLPSKSKDLNPCEEAGCQKSYWSDDSSDEESEIEESPTSKGEVMKKVLMMRQKVVRAFSGTDAPAKVTETNSGGEERNLDEERVAEWQRMKAEVDSLAIDLRKANLEMTESGADACTGCEDRYSSGGSGGRRKYRMASGSCEF